MKVKNIKNETPIDKAKLAEADNKFKQFSADIQPDSKKYYELLLVISIIMTFAKKIAVALLERLLKVLRGESLVDAENLIRSDPKLKGLADALYSKNSKK